MSKKRTTFEIIGDRYLDTQFESEYINQLEVELKLRGVTGTKRLILEYLAASSLWWNVLWWEWVSLNELDVKLGWKQNFVFFGSISLAVWFFLGFTAAVAAFIVVHIATTCLGFLLRRGTVKT